MKTKAFDSDKIKKTIQKVISTARAGLEMYFAFKKKDPIYVGMGLLSTYNALEQLLAKNPNNLRHKLAGMGFERILWNMESLVYDVLTSVGMLGTVWHVHKDDDNSETAIRFEIDGCEVYFVISSGVITCAYARDEDEFIHVFSKVIEDKLGPYINVCVELEKWKTTVKVKEADIPTTTYVSTLDINEHYEAILKFRSKNLNRSSLLFGPPGCGKTTYAAKMTNMLSGRLVILNAPSLNFMANFGIDITKIFRVLSPTVILFDDIDRLEGSSLDLMLGTIEAVNRYKDSGDIIIMGSVNNLSSLPLAMRRPGRFDEIIVFDKPDAQQRRNIIKTYMKHYGVRLANIHVETIVEETDGMTPAYLDEIVKQADVHPFYKIPGIIQHMKRMSNNDCIEEECAKEKCAERAQRPNDEGYEKTISRS